MAIQSSVKTEFGLELPAAYIRISSTATTGKDVLVFTAGMFADSNHPAITQRQYTCPLDLNGPNPIKQAYLHLKSLPEFAGATDC
jgi:hypothetical protein